MKVVIEDVPERVKTNFNELVEREFEGDKADAFAWTLDASMFWSARINALWEEINRIRRKLGESPEEEESIKTLSGRRIK